MQQVRHHLPQDMFQIFQARLRKDVNKIQISKLQNVKTTLHISHIFLLKS